MECSWFEDIAAITILIIIAIDSITIEVQNQPGPDQ